MPQMTPPAMAQIRAQYLSEHEGSMEYLTWERPGSVWAADFTQPELPIDGCFPYLLSVRDLAACYQLLLLPVRQADAAAVCLAMVHLFAAHGPPLVLKTDNGSPFIADHTLRVLLPRDILHLVSPPLTPRYHGSIEAGIGAVKSRALLVAAANGRSDCWTLLRPAKPHAKKPITRPGLLEETVLHPANGGTTDAKSPPNNAGPSSTPSPTPRRTNS